MDKEERRALILGVVENQLRDNNPPETRQTLERLMASGTAREEAMRLIGNALASEIFEITKYEREFDLARYVGLLHALPELPWATK